MKILSFCCIRNWQIKSRFLCTYLCLSNIVLGSFLFLSLLFMENIIIFSCDRRVPLLVGDCKDLVTVDDWIGSRFLVVNDFFVQKSWLYLNCITVTRQNMLCILYESPILGQLLDLISPAAQCKNVCPERLNWPGWLAGISERARGISKNKFLDHFSPSFLSQKCSFQELRF